MMEWWFLRNDWVTPNPKERSDWVTPNSAILIAVWCKEKIKNSFAIVRWLEKWAKLWNRERETDGTWSIVFLAHYNNVLKVILSLYRVF